MGLFKLKDPDGYSEINWPGIIAAVFVLGIIAFNILAWIFGPPTMQAAILPGWLWVLRWVLLLGGAALVIAGLIDKKPLLVIIGIILIPIGIIGFILLLPLNL